jgi:shikimate dehydrogenase
MNARRAFTMSGIVGWPVTHSRSPMLHGYWLRHYDIKGAYLPLAVRPGRLEQALRGVSALGFAGCNLTLPHKEEAARLVDRVDATAARIGAVNTVVVQSDGSLSGSNTDAYGFIENLRDGCRGWRADAGPAVVLGAGGAARSVVVSLIDAGVGEIRLLNRTRGRAEELRAAFGRIVQALDWRERDAALAGAALLVNATNQGMVGQAPLELRLDALPRAAVVNDLVYNPLETPLLRDARGRGNAVVDGLGMLLHQARPGFEAWFGVAPAITPELRAAIEASIG